MQKCTVKLAETGGGGDGEGAYAKYENGVR